MAPRPLRTATPSQPATTPAARPLSGLELHQTALVQQVRTGANGQGGERAQQLADIGFVPGEGVSVVARAWPGGDPLVVLVGHSRFALRRAEADCIWVQS